MEVEISFYRPEGVVGFLGTGINSFIGLVDETTVCKYPHSPNDEFAIAALDAEIQIFEAIGPHERIIGFKGRTEHGILLERAPFGSVDDYLRKHNPTTQQRLEWAMQAAEAVMVIHRRGVIHCDLNAGNLLLDAGLNIKLCDFQGRLLGPDGKIECNGGATDNVKSTMPRADPYHQDQKTDMFALGSVFYFIMTGHEPFPELDNFTQQGEIVEKFKTGQYPELECSLMNNVVHKCWSGKYDSADEIVRDLAPQSN